MEKRLPRCNFLCKALLNEKEDIAKLLIERGAEVKESRNGIATPLHDAVEKGHTAVVTMLLEKGALVNAKDNLNETSLHRAVKSGKLEIIELLLNKMADVNAKANDRTTPLHLAIQLLGKTPTSIDKFDHALASRCQLCVSSLEVTMNTTDATKTEKSREDVVQLLLDRGADVDAPDWTGHTVLWNAVKQCNFRIIEPILLSRPDVRLNELCLHKAVASAGVEYKGIVELLVGYGFKLKRADAEHPRLLHNAVRNGYTTIVNDLLTQGASVEMRHGIANGGTLLHSAALSGQMTIAELLVERGADVNAKDENGKTPILYAVENMDTAMTRFFLTNGANDKGRRRLLHTAAEQFCSHIVEMILEHIPSIDVNAVENVASTRLRFFVKVAPSLESYYDPLDDTDTAGADQSGVFDGGEAVNVEKSYKVTALHVAAAGGFARIVELLLEHNANIDSFAKKVGTPLHCSVLQTNEAIVDMLLRKGAEVDADRGDGTTPLHLAVREGNATAFELLIKHGADVHKRNNSGLNLVHMAIEDGHLKMFEEDLLDVFMAGHPRTTDQKFTALHIAVEIGDLADVEILLRHGADASVGDKSGCTPLHNAIVFDFDGGVVEALLDSLDDIDSREDNGNTALHVAAGGGNEEAVRLLLFHGSDVNILDNRGNTPLTEMYDDTLYERQRGVVDDAVHPLSADDSSTGSVDEDSYSRSWRSRRFRRSMAKEDSRIIQVAAMIQERIVKLMALGVDVNDENKSFVDVSSLHKNIYDKCNEEIRQMKISKMGKSKVSFYEFLTTGKEKLAFYSRNPKIAKALKRGDYKRTFKLYGDLIESRFRKAKMLNDLVDSSAGSLKALSGYSLSDDDVMGIFRYLDRRDLRNVILASGRDEKSKKNYRSLARVTIPKKRKML